MKLRVKIILLSVIPAVVLGLFMYLFSTTQIDEASRKQIYKGLKSSAMLTQELINTSSEGEYQLKGDQLYKGEACNLSEQNDLIDSIKEESGYDVTVFYKDTRYLTTVMNDKGERQIGTQASDEVVKAVLKNGDTYQNDNIDILGKRYVGYYVPLCQEGTDQVVGMLFLGEEYSKVHAIAHNAKGSLGIGEGILLILTIIVVYLIAQRMVRAISKGISYVTYIGEGKLGFPKDKKILERKDAIGDMCRSIEKLDDHLLAIVKGVKGQCDLLEQTSEMSAKVTSDALKSVEQIDQTVREIAENSNAQAQNAQNANESVELMGNMIEDTKKHIGILADTTDSTAASSNRAKSILAELNDNMVHVKDAMQEVEDKTNQTHVSVEQVSNMTQIITEIATQTSLLSLNASIEAARAGEQGKGFSVVASEIQKLAEQSNEAAEDIQKVLHQLQEDSDSSVETMKTVRRIIEEQESKISCTNEIFETVQDNIKYSIDGIRDIRNQAEMLNNTRTGAVGTVQNVAAIAQENAASVEEAAAFTDAVTGNVCQVVKVVNEVKNVADKLEEQVNVFQVE